jgi:hypothetical protein
MGAVLRARRQGRLEARSPHRDARLRDRRGVAGHESAGPIKGAPKRQLEGFPDTHMPRGSWGFDGGWSWLRWRVGVASMASGCGLDRGWSWPRRRAVVASIADGRGLDGGWAWPRSRMVMASMAGGRGLDGGWAWPRSRMVMASMAGGRGLDGGWAWPRSRMVVASIADGRGLDGGWAWLRWRAVAASMAGGRGFDGGWAWLRWWAVVASMGCQILCVTCLRRARRFSNMMAKWASARPQRDLGSEPEASSLRRIHPWTNRRSIVRLPAPTDPEGQFLDVREAPRRRPAAGDQGMSRTFPPAPFSTRACPSAAALSGSRCAMGIESLPLWIAPAMYRSVFGSCFDTNTTTRTDG